MRTTTFRDLVVWQKSFVLAKGVHDTTKLFPRDELFGLTSQLRRASSSVPSNIAEGHGRLTTGEFLNQLSVSRGSLNEMRTQLLLAAEYGYVSDDDAAELEALCDEVGRVLWALISGIHRKRKGPSK
jgi:four helix bundle protein